MRARLRADVFHALTNEVRARGTGRWPAREASPRRPPTPQDSKPPELPHDNLILNELIREYLEYNGYKSASSVLVAGPRPPDNARQRPDSLRTSLAATESGQPADPPFSREFLAEQVNLRSSDPNVRSVPLLYAVLNRLRNAGGDGAGTRAPAHTRPAAERGWGQGSAEAPAARAAVAGGGPPPTGADPAYDTTGAAGSEADGSRPRVREGTGA